MTLDYGVTPQGFRAKRLIDIKNELESLFIAEFGDINLDAQSVTGQLIGVYSKVLADIWENMNDVYLSQYPNSASGISLDNVVQLNGLTRIPEQRTSVIGVVTGTPNTLIPQGVLARIPSTNEVFFSTVSGFIANSNAVANTIRVRVLASTSYTAVISGVSYVYGNPFIQFTGPIVLGNAISVRLNGINIPTVPFSGSNASTLADLGAAIVANSLGAITASNVIGNSVRFTVALGRQAIFSTPSVSGGGAPTASILYSIPDDLGTVAVGLSLIINNAPNVTSTVAGVPLDSLRVVAADSEFPYSLNVSSNLEITSVSSPIPFIAQTYGPVPAPENTLTEILTPIAGWQSITNFKAGATGRFQETDAELRLRRANSLRLLGAATVEAIRARLLQEVPGVSSVTIFENVTLTQTPISVTFSADFVTGNSISITIDTTTLASVPFVTNQLTTMSNIATAIQSQTQIKAVTVGGVGNRVLTIEMNEVQDVEISFNITGGASQPTYILSGGRSPKSFEAVVQGGTDNAVALKIWQTKPAGIETFGNLTVNIIDSQGQTQAISFTRADPVYIWVTVVLTLNPQESFPSNGQQLVSDAILVYGNTLGIGVDVFIQRVLAQIFTVPGIASATVQLARTLSESDTPVYAALDVDITDTEVSVWSLSRITVGL